MIYKITDIRRKIYLVPASEDNTTKLFRDFDGIMFFVTEGFIMRMSEINSVIVYDSLEDYIALEDPVNGD